MRTTGMMAGAAMLAGCAAMPPPGAPVPIERETITYATAPCFGTCPVYRVIVMPDGRGTFVGERFTAVTGSRDFTLSPDAYRRFAAALAPYRPENERLIQPGTPDCRHAPTDMPSIDIRWSEASGGAQHLAFYKGCRAGNEPLAAALDAAPALLPIGDLIDRR